MAKCTRKCPGCGSAARRDAKPVGSVHLQRWLCGTQEQYHGKPVRSETCYERELAAVNAEIERLRAQVERLKSEMTNSQLHNACE